jgi:hypothetical protein
MDMRVELPANSSNSNTRSGSLMRERAYSQRMTFGNDSVFSGRRRVKTTNVLFGK